MPECSMCHTPIDPNGQFIKLLVHNFGKVTPLHLCNNPRCPSRWVEKSFNRER